jgi:hypothetical protein
MQHNPAIFESLFKRNFSDPGNKNFLQEITEAHPYFSPAQFYLLQQTEEGTDAFKKQAARTNILFNNPYWLYYQLQRPKQEMLPGERTLVEPEMKIVPDEKREEEKETEPIQQELNIPEEKDTLNGMPLFEPGMKIVTDEKKEEEEEEEKEIEPMKLELKIPEEKNTLNEMPLFEPMHMVDYFASQGIKLSEETQPSDKLGRQLKSFTEWLKTMKKVHGENATETAVHSDTAIQNLAEKSNKEDEVLTVSMADVFAKQGKIDKAVEVLQKLSLLNPDKSAYFAAKIEYLKGL